MKIRRPPEWGIEPVPAKFKFLRAIDIFVLWSSLSVGLLVLLAGSLLTSSEGFALTLGNALFAIVVGSIIGCLFLALTGVIGADLSVPTMVLVRPALGVRGSYIPTILNIIQLVGWTAFEFRIMGEAANALSSMYLGFSCFHLWLAVFAIWCMLLALGGPIAVVREWLEKFAIWLVYGSTIWMTYYFLTHIDFSKISMALSWDVNLLMAIDLVVAMPISWMPLIADYNRFASSPSSSFKGTFTGYLIANVWFYSLGAIAVLATVEGDLLSSILSITFGSLALMFILVDETDNAFADIYSVAVSAQNIVPKLKQWKTIIAVTAISFTIAALVDIVQYEWFLLWIGSVFCPLFGVVAADYFLVNKRKYDVDQLYAEHGKYWGFKGVNPIGLVSWIIGVAIYYIIIFYASWLGASIPSFLLSMVIHYLLSKVRKIEES